MEGNQGHRGMYYEGVMISTMVTDDVLCVVLLFHCVVLTNKGCRPWGYFERKEEVAIKLML